MARPIKAGLDYFPLDVHLDDKFELIEAEFGLDGFGVVVKLLQKIYGEQGYYIEWTNEVALLFGRRVGLGGNVVSEIVSASVKRGIFDQDIFDKYSILTSKGIQKRYFEAVSRRKNITIENQYLLVKVGDFKDNVANNPINVRISPENVSNNPQTKVNKSKEKKEPTGREKDLQILFKVWRENNFGDITRMLVDELNRYLDLGFEVDLLKAAMLEAVQQNARRLKYVLAILKRCEAQEVKTAAAFKERQQKPKQAVQGSRSHIPPEEDILLNINNARAKP